MQNGFLAQGFGVHRHGNDGKLRRILAIRRFSTAGLHRPNPVARETPGFSGFFAPRGQVAEREGLPHRDRDANKMKCLRHGR
jgi:hypothetical protein